jgi:pSer/pThr/pTyr-binding forkhead associated (FHA) protein
MNVEPVLLALQAAFLILLYVFIWRVVRSAGRDMQVAPQESFILAPSQMAAEHQAPDPALDRDEFASGHHARIESQRDAVWLLDLGSTNGTFVNGERVEGRRQLHRGDLVQIGDTELRFER